MGVMLPVFILAISGFFFFLLQASSYQDVYYTYDANVYFCHAGLLQQGEMLYRDFFYPNLPLTPVWSLLYRIVSGENLQLYFTIANLEPIVGMTLLYLICRKLFNNDWIALLCSLFYVSTQSILVTSRTPFFVHVALGSMLSAYLSSLYGKYRLAGAFAALGLFTKIYTCGYLVGLCVVQFLKKRTEGLWFAFAFGVVALGILIPVVFFAGQEFVEQVMFSVAREGGSNRWAILSHFFTYHWIHVLLIGYMIMFSRKNLFVSLSGGISLAFLLLFQDIFPVYFTLIVPPAAIALGYVLKDTIPHLNPKYVYGAVATGIAIMGMFTMQNYSQNLTTSSVDKTTVKNVISEHSPEYVYGVYGITQAVSHETGIPVVNNLCDLQPKLFDAGIIDIEPVNKELFSHRSLVMVNANVESEDVYTTYGERTLDLVRVLKECQLVEEEPFDWLQSNTLRFYLCEPSDDK